LRQLGGDWPILLIIATWLGMWTVSNRAGSREPSVATDTNSGSLIMGKGNKVRKKEVKKPKQDKKGAKK
jgi:hypothetical protein